MRRYTKIREKQSLQVERNFSKERKIQPFEMEEQKVLPEAIENKMPSIQFSTASRLSMSLIGDLETHSSIMCDDFSQNEKVLMEKLQKVRKSIVRQYGGFEAQK